MHVIQKQTLNALTSQGELRFSELKPLGVESNIFMYHLKKLMSHDLVEKSGVFYRLTSAGKRYVDQVSFKNLEPRIQPKIVTLVVCHNASGDTLFYRRQKEPFREMVGLPHGKIHLGETLTNAADRELKEKTGLKASTKHVGDVYITVYAKKKLITHMLSHVFVAKNPTGKLIPASLGECFWVPPTATHYDFMPGSQEILKLVQQKKRGHFFHEFVFHI